MGIKKGRKEKSDIDEEDVGGLWDEWKIHSDEARSMVGVQSIDSLEPQPGPWINVEIEAWQIFDSPEKAPKWPPFCILLNHVLEEDTGDTTLHIDYETGSRFKLSCGGGKSDTDFGQDVIAILSTLELCVRVVLADNPEGHEYSASLNECDDDRDGPCICEP